MVRGLDTFRKYFRGFENQYVLIGGAACDKVIEKKREKMLIPVIYGSIRMIFFELH